MDFEKKVLRTSRGTIVYYVAGRGNPILFLHGVGVQAMTYKRILEILAKDHRIIAPDLPGFGGSDVPKTVWDLRDYAQVTEKILESENISNVIVIGHSFGGRIALLLATISGRLTKVIVLNASGTPPQEGKLTLAYRFFFSKSNYLPYTLAHIKTMSVIVRDFFSNVMRRIIYVPHISSIIFNCLYKDYQEIKGVCIPVLLVRSTHDPLVQDEELLTMKHLIPHINFKEIQGDHNTILFHPDVMLAHISQYLD